MSAFADMLRTAVLAAESPDGTVRITAHGDGSLDVEVDERKLRYHDESSLAQQVEAVVAKLLRANQRAYVQAWRATSPGLEAPPDGAPAEPAR